MRLMVVFLKSELWREHDISQAAADAKNSGRRIVKRLDLPRERNRFSLACELLETAAWQRREGHDVVAVEGNEAELLIDSLPSEREVVYPFVEPAEINNFADRLPRELGYLEKYVRKERQGLVVVHSPYHHAVNAADKSVDRKEGTCEMETSATHRPDTVEVKPFEGEICLSSRKEVELFHGRIQESVQLGLPLNVSHVKHEVFTETVRNYLYKTGSEDVSYLQISYSDGSEGAVFPLFSLDKISRPVGLTNLNVGMVSMRHGEGLDDVVDIYLLRNNEVQFCDTYAEQESRAYRRCREIFSELIRDQEGLEIYLYHTGLEPTVVGTYLGILELLQRYRKQVVVVPMFVRADGYWETLPWF